MIYDILYIYTHTSFYVLHRIHIIYDVLNHLRANVGSVVVASASLGERGMHAFPRLSEETAFSTEHVPKKRLERSTAFTAMSHRRAGLWWWPASLFSRRQAHSCADLCWKSWLADLGIP